MSQQHTCDVHPFRTRGRSSEFQKFMGFFRISRDREIQVFFPLDADSPQTRLDSEYVREEPHSTRLAHFSGVATLDSHPRRVQLRRNRPPGAHFAYTCMGKQYTNPMEALALARSAGSRERGRVTPCVSQTTKFGWCSALLCANPHTSPRLSSARRTPRAREHRRALGRSRRSSFDSRPPSIAIAMASLVVASAATSVRVAAGSRSSRPDTEKSTREASRPTARRAPRRGPREVKAAAKAPLTTSDRRSPAGSPSPTTPSPSPSRSPSALARRPRRRT